MCKRVGREGVKMLYGEREGCSWDLRTHIKNGKGSSCLEFVVAEAQVNGLVHGYHAARFLQEHSLDDLILKPKLFELLAQRSPLC